jgi:ATP synthase I chain
MKSSPFGMRPFFVEKVTAIVYIVMTLGSVPLWNLSITLGVLLGGGLGLANIDLLIRIGKKVFAEPGKTNTAYAAFAWIKFVVLVAILFFALQSEHFNPVALVVGLSDMVVGIVAGTIIWALKKPAEPEFDDPDEDTAD